MSLSSLSFLLHFLSHSCYIFKRKIFMRIKISTDTNSNDNIISSFLHIRSAGCVCMGFIVPAFHSERTTQDNHHTFSSYVIRSYSRAFRVFQAYLDISGDIRARTFRASAQRLYLCHSIRNVFRWNIFGQH